MTNSPNIRIPMEDHEEAERIAIKITAKKQKIITKNEVIKKAIKIGLKELSKENDGCKSKI